MLATKNVATVLIGAVLILALSFSFATPAKADLLSDLQAQVQALLAQISALQGGSSSSGSCAAFTRNHQLGDTGGEVLQIQKFLNSHGAVVSASGAGSVGNESTYFGAKTKAAVAKWQAANGVSPAAGYWGPITRAKANTLCTGTGTGTTPTPSGSGIVVTAGTQPANSLAPEGASRVPFTTFTITNNSGAAATINGVTVKRTGLANNSVFSGVILVDSQGLQVGTSKTLNSNDQATVGDTWTINPGQSQTFTVAGNMSSSLDSYSGQVVSLSVVGINTTATVSGSLPITGAQQTINSTLTIGTVSTSSSAFDPGNSTTKSIGDSSIKFSGVRFTANSAEDVRLFSIRWRQVGSASAVDLGNVQTFINGTAYPTTVDASGKYYTTVVPGGVLIAKGNSIDVYVQGDIVGSNASGRTIAFDIDKLTDVYLVGQTFGYGVGFTPSYTNTPWYDGWTVTVQGGTATTIGKANEVAAQNIAVNVANQPLGGFVTDFKGEAVSVQSMSFTVSSSTGAGTLTSVSLVDENGLVVAGPVDTASASSYNTITFTDTVTFPVGRKVYTIKGKVGTGAATGKTIALSTTPSSWSNVTGQTSGNTVTLSQGAFSMNTMTVRAAALQVAVSASPAAQNIVAGGQGVHLATYQFDATQSGEDVRFSAVETDLSLTNGSFEGDADNLTSCQLWDGATAVNTGSNIVNPTSSATSSNPIDTPNFTFDNPVVVTKGTVKELQLKCNVSSGSDANSTFQFGMTSTHMGQIAAVGVTSGNSVTPTGTTANGQLMTVASGGLVASLDPSSPSYALVSGGSTGVTLGVFKLRPSTESVNLQRVGLTLTNDSNASSSASDLLTVTLYNGTTAIGTATFVGSNTNATSTLTSPLLLPKDTDTVITVKGDMANVGGSNAGTTGHLVKVDIDANSTGNTQGTGVGSGASINASGTTAVSGVRLFKSFPIVAKEAAPTNTLSNGQKTLLRFKVTADSKGSIGVGKVTLRIATTTAAVTDLNVYAYTDSAYSTPASGLRSDGALLAADILATGNTTWASSATDLNVVASTPVQIPAGGSRWFAVIATVSGSASGASVSTQLQGDAAYPSHANGTFDDTLSNIDSDTNDDFIWSPNTDGTTAVGTADWTNGFGVVGLPSSNVAAEVLTP